MSLPRAVSRLRTSRTNLEKAIAEIRQTKGAEHYAGHHGALHLASAELHHVIGSLNSMMRLIQTIENEVDASREE